MVLQEVFTTPLSGFNPIENFLRRFSTTPTDVSIVDLRVANLSVHRVRYVDDNGDGEAANFNHEAQEPHEKELNTRRPMSLMSIVSLTEEVREITAKMAKFILFPVPSSDSTKPRKRTEVSSVVVTWEDHAWAAQARLKEKMEMEEKSGGEGGGAAGTQSILFSPGQTFSYELQHWVNGWGFDAFLHPSNRKIVTSDPFVVLSNLPPDYEISFRVRIKVKKTTGFLSGFFATETEGPWSPVVTLSPSQDDAFEAILVFLAANKAFFLVLATCIGSGSLIVFHLLIGTRLRRTFSGGANSSQSNAIMTATGTPPPLSSRKLSSRRSSSSNAELDQEIRDLRQELADSEAEVRKLMLYRGYGIEALTPEELRVLERELFQTIKRVQVLQRVGGRGSVRCLSEEEEEDEEEMENDEGIHTGRHAMHTIYEDATAF